MTNSIQRQEQRNIELIQNVLEWQNQGDIEAYLNVLTDDYIWTSQAMQPYPQRFVGVEGAKRGLMLLVRTFPDMKQEQTFITASNDTVTQVTRARGTRTNGFMGLPTIDKPWEFTTCNLYTLTIEGKIRKSVFFWDRAFTLGLLGVIPQVGVFGPPPGLTADWKLCQGHGASAPEALPEPPETLSDILAEVVQFPVTIWGRVLQLISNNPQDSRDLWEGSLLEDHVRGASRR